MLTLRGIITLIVLIVLFALAESFKQGVEALIESAHSAEDFDAFLERFAGMAQQPVVMH